jgi:hypothetical protein
MAEPNGLVSGGVIDPAFDVCSWADNQIEALLQAIQAAVTGTFPTDMNPDFYDYYSGPNAVMINGTPVDPHEGAGTLLIDRMMSELSNLESISANAVATSQRIQKEINSKLT